MDLGCARDCVRFPLLGFELRVFQPQNLDLHSYEYSELTGNREPESVVLSDGEVLESGRWVAVVNKIYPTSPAERAGLHVGGTVTAMHRIAYYITSYNLISRCRTVHYITAHHI